MADDISIAKTGARDIRAEVSPEEWQTRIDLAACYRLVDLYGMSDLVANHISVAVPNEPEHFLINPYGLLYEEMHASAMIKIDLDGNTVHEPLYEQYPVNRAGFIIHACVHRARPETGKCVIHTHTDAGMAVSVLECGLLPITQTSMRFKDVAYHKYEGPATNIEEQVRLVEHLGESSLMVLHNHGLLAVGADIPQTFNHIHRAELSCRTQVMAMACGVPLINADPDVIERTYRNYLPNRPVPFGYRDWPALLRKLDRLDPSYKD